MISTVKNSTFNLNDMTQHSTAENVEQETMPENQAASTENQPELERGQSSSVVLPSPVDYPQTDVLIYDGHCRMCTAQVQRISRLDGKHRVTFISLHDPYVAEHYPDLTHDAMMKDMYLIDRRGRRHKGAAAFRYLSRRLPKLWPIAPLMNIPLTLPIMQWVYRQVAKRRYRFGKLDECENGSCSVHFE